MSQKRLFRTVALEQLSSPDQLDQLMPITTPQTWLVASSILVLIVMIAVWGLTGRLPVTVEGQGKIVKTDDGKFEALLYVSIESIHEINEGNTVQIDLLTINTKAHGMLLGKVVAINLIPTENNANENTTTKTDKAAVVAYDEQYNEVRIQLQTNENGAYNFTIGEPWTVQLNDALPIFAQITVDEVQPLQLILPNQNN